VIFLRSGPDVIPENQLDTEIFHGMTNLVIKQRPGAQPTASIAVPPPASYMTPNLPQSNYAPSQPGAQYGAPQRYEPRPIAQGQDLTKLFDYELPNSIEGLKAEGMGSLLLVSPTHKFFVCLLISLATLAEIVALALPWHSLSVSTRSGNNSIVQD
jgi:hypothetical protein